MNVQLKQTCQRLSLSLLLTTCRDLENNEEEYSHIKNYIEINELLLLGIYI